MSEEKAKTNLLEPWFFGDGPGTPLVGIARLADEAELADTGHLTEYRSLSARSILNNSESKRGLPFRKSINPYRGCEFGCKYCYARYTHEFMGMEDGREFESRIYAKGEDRKSVV